MRTEGIASMAKHKRQKSKHQGPRPSRPPELVAQSLGYVLLVDDDPLVVEAGQGMLEFLGYETVERTSSVEALEVFRDAPQRFDLVITDFNMPVMKGDVLAQQLWGIRPDIPIVLCTSSSAVIREKSQIQDFDALLKKPFDIRAMAASIEQALARRATHRM